MDKLFIKMTQGRRLEKKYIIEEVFRLMRLDAEIVIIDSEIGSGYVLTDNKGLDINFPDVFFCNAENNWCETSSLPQKPIGNVIINEEIKCLFNSENIPVLYGKINPGDYFYKRNKFDNIEVGVDVFGSAFYMLTNYEEYVAAHKDRHDRFLAKNSLLLETGIIDRPIINEYIEIVFKITQNLWPTINRKNKNFTQYITHDIDAPYSYKYGNFFEKVIRQAWHDIYKYNSYGLMLSHLRDSLCVKMGKLSYDPYSRVEWLLNKGKEGKYKPAFYFISSNNDIKINGRYNFWNPEIVSLFKLISDQGGEIGLHSSYYAHRDYRVVKKELNELKYVCKENGINQEKWGVRQHYLRWSVSETPVSFAKAGLDYDTTCGFPDYIGFKVGLCQEYYPFNFNTRSKVNIIERPLLVMDTTVMDKSYMGINGESDIIEMILNIKNKCKRYNGDFTLLWHNSSLVVDSEKDIFSKIVLS